MSVSGIGGANNNWFVTRSQTSEAKPTTSSAQPRGPLAALKAVGQDLAAGNLAQAQSDWQTVTAASGQAMNAQDSNAFGQQMSALGTALQGGDLASAQSAFQSLSSTLQSSGVHHHHHHHGGGSAAISSGSSLAQSAQGTTSTDPFAAAIQASPDADGDGDTSAAQPATAASNPFAASFDAIGKALQSGDLAGAQAAFATLRQQLATAPTSLVSSGGNATAQPGSILDLTA